MKTRFFYTWFVPLLWSIFSVISFFHSGDEHGCFVYGTIITLWIGFFLSFNSLTAYLFTVLPIGIIILGFFGFLMDKIQVSKLFWSALLVIVIPALFFHSMNSYESLEKMAFKHRSIVAVIFMDCNLGLYISIVFSMLGNLFRRLLVKAGLRKIFKSRPFPGS